MQRKIHCPTGADDSWSQFAWEDYPGGVRVTIVPVDRSGRVGFLRPSLWQFNLLEFYLKPDMTLRHAQDFFQAKASEVGLEGINRYGEGFMVVDQLVEGSTLHLIAQLSFTQTRSDRRMEWTGDRLMIAGYMHGNPAAKLVCQHFGRH